MRSQERHKVNCENMGKLSKKKLKSGLRRLFWKHQAIIESVVSYQGSATLKVDFLPDLVLLRCDPPVNG